MGLWNDGYKLAYSETVNNLLSPGVGGVMVSAVYPTKLADPHLPIHVNMENLASLAGNFLWAYS